MSTTDLFGSFLRNILLTEAQVLDGETKYRHVSECLNRTYYSTSSAANSSLRVGSWGRNTHIRPPRDIDVYFVMPPAAYARFEMRTGNKQSQILQEVRDVLIQSYPNTRIRADGHVVMVPFTSFGVEVSPVFASTRDGEYILCETHNGGRYKRVGPQAALQHLETADQASHGRTRRLIRYMKSWQNTCNVPLRSFWLELLCINFVRNGVSRDTEDAQVVCDFFAYLLTQVDAILIEPGTGDLIPIGRDWFSRAETALRHAQNALQLYRQAEKYILDARMGLNAAIRAHEALYEWQHVFGTDLK